MRTWSMVIVTAACVLAASLDLGAQTKPDSLYKRVGGYDAVAAVVDDFVPRLAGDPKLAKFFAGHAAESLKRIRQLVVDQLCNAMGGPCLYLGRDTRTAHAGLGITAADWDISVGHLKATLAKFKVPPKETEEVLSLATTLRKDIVEKP